MEEIQVTVYKCSECDYTSHDKSDVAFHERIHKKQELCSHEFGYALELDYNDPALYIEVRCQHGCGYSYDIAISTEDFSQAELRRIIATKK